MKRSTPQYSKKMVFNIFVVIVLGWLLLFCWSMTLWLRFGFDNAWQKLYQLSEQQRTTITPFDSVAMTERLHAVLKKIPTVNVSKIHRALPYLTQNTMVNEAWRMAKRVWILVVMTSSVMLIKLITFITAIPLFLLSMTAGLVDGLNQRAIRTASLGRESSYVFHQLNRLLKRGLIVLLGLWLAIPVSITPELIFVPVSLLLSVMVSMTASRFKKYL